MNGQQLVILPRPSCRPGALRTSRLHGRLSAFVGLGWAGLGRTSCRRGDQPCGCSAAPFLTQDSATNGQARTSVSDKTPMPNGRCPARCLGHHSVAAARLPLLLEIMHIRCLAIHVFKSGAEPHWIHDGFFFYTKERRRLSA